MHRLLKRAAHKLSLPSWRTLLGGGADEQLVPLPYGPAVPVKPRDPATWIALGLAFTHENQLTHAILAFRQALDLDPVNVAALDRLGDVYRKCGRIEDAVAVYRRGLAREPRADMHAKLIMTMGALRGVRTDDIIAESRRWHALYAAGLAPKQPNLAKPVTARRKTHVGVASSGFGRHATGVRTIAAFEALDRHQFTLTLYAGGSAQDDVRRRFRDTASAWHAVSNLSDETLAAKIAADGIDILIDLDGHGEGSRLLAFARRPAPVQVSWAGPTVPLGGTDAFDHILADATLMPESDNSLYTENIIRLPGGYATYAPPVDAPEVAPLPALVRRRVTFGAFASLDRIGDDTIALWARVLDRVEDSYLLLRAAALADPFVCRDARRRFAAHGIGENRLEIKGVTAHRHPLDDYRRIDIALDTCPVSGGIDCAEALWMGVPVVTLRGLTPAARSGASCLAGAGLTAFLCDNADDYVERAALWAQDIDVLSALRRTLRDEVAASPLCDGVRLGRALSNALGLMQHQATLDDTASAA